MSRKDELRVNRVKKLENIKKDGLLPYPVQTKRTHTIAESLTDFIELEKKEEEIVVVGRVRSFREHGKIAFFDIEDGTGKIQAFISEDLIGESPYLFFLQNFDIGDFIETRGVLFLTKRNERSIKVANVKMLSKSLLPLPEKWHGLQDTEERYRKRYLDLMFNPEVKKNFEIRSKIIKELRSFLDEKGFLEVETPILQPIYGGAGAKPFKTYLNALSMDFYLRIAPELYLKRLLVGGFEKVYEIGRCFRNEGMDRSHNPDFTSLEFYLAYADYKQLMTFTEDMLITVMDKVFGSKEMWYEEEKINLSAPWTRVQFYDVIRKETGIDLEEINRDALYKEAEKMGIKIEKGADKARISDEIFKDKCRHTLRQPTFVIHHPQGFQPLAKPLSDNPGKLANFQLYIAGWEVVNAFSELNDPLEQRRVFKEQEKMLKEGFEEAQRMDEDFLEALEHGMPPAAGFGMGIDRLAAILTGSHSLREIILFPAMKNRKK